MFVTKVLIIKSCIHTTRLATRHHSVCQLMARNLSQSPNSDDKQKQSSREHLTAVYRQLSESLPQFFSSRHCYQIYSPKVVFEDNIRHVKTIGLNDYIKQLSFIIFWAHIKYSYKSLEVLKITEHPEDMTVRVRWRVVGTPGFGVMLMFWKYPFWGRTKSVGKDRSEWTDGFSIFSVGADGLVHKHTVEKIMPDEDRQPSKSNIADAKNLAFIVGFVPQVSQFDINYQQLLSKLLELTTKCSFG